MKPELIIIDTDDGVIELIDYLRDKELIAYDCETTGVTNKDQVIGFSICAEEAKAYYVVLSAWNGSELIPSKGIMPSVNVLIEWLKTKQLIMHNGVFDCMMAEAYFKIKLIDNLHTDTMVLAHLLDENRRVGLKELTKEYFGEDATAEQEEMKASVLANGGIWTSKVKEMYKADSHILAKYGAKDALLTYKLFMQLVPELYEQGLDKFFYEEESMPLLRGPTYELNTTGLQVDQTALITLKKTLEAECAEAKAFIYKEIDVHIKDKYPGTNKKNGFNIGSSQQLSWLLFGKLQLEFSTLTDGGKTACRAMNMKIPYTFSAKRDFIAICERDKGDIAQPEATVNGKKVKAKLFKDPWAYIACDKATLIKLAPKYKWIERLLEYQRKTKILKTYVKGIESRTQYGIIQPSFLQHGTTSGRYSSRNPNFQNLPRDDKRIKAAIVARSNNVFVGADYSQLEPRVFAYYSKDKRLLEAFDGTSDFYSVIGIEVYSKFDSTPQKEGSKEAFGIKYKTLRDDVKRFALAATYGGTAHQISSIIGKSVDATQEDINSYFENFPGVADMMLEAHSLAKKNGFVTSLFGRPRRMPEAKRIEKLYGNKSHAELPYEARNLLNLAVNHRVQSTSASIVNRAAIRFYNNCKELGLDCKLVAQVHDSLVVECNTQDAETISLLLQSAMEDTTQLEGIRLEALPKIGYTLAEV